MKKRAIISVSNKSGIVELAQRLEALDFEIVSTGGTKTALEAAGIKVTNISDITNFPECLDGRLKTLHPNVHGGILAMRSNTEHMSQLQELSIAPIDLVVINLYPFKETILKENVTLGEAIENIDIGGPTMLRAAAKNWQDVIVMVDPDDYGLIVDKLEKGTLTKEDKFALASKVFSHTAHYDALIANYLHMQNAPDTFPDLLTLTYEKAQEMRYGENPHQSAAFYREVGTPKGTIAAAKQLHGKELSFNNISDGNSAIDLVKEFDVPCAVAVKHANPCGVGIADNLYDAYISAYNADPVSIYGGIVALNRTCDVNTAAELAKIYLEIVIAPSFTDEALEILTRKANIRLLELEGLDSPNSPDMIDLKKVGGGILIQDINTKIYDGELTTVTDRAPTEDELKALDFAWKVVKHTKSNAIVLSNDKNTIGIGPGQTNRITALELAIKYGGDKVNGCVMASDAFFPFGDCVEAAAAAGITAIIQPGGSIRDQESIDACNKHGIAMVFTGMRHFRH